MEKIEIIKDYGDLLAVFKPSGMLTIPGRGENNKPILSHLLGDQLRPSKIKDWK